MYQVRGAVVTCPTFLLSLELLHDTKPELWSFVVIVALRVKLNRVGWASKLEEIQRAVFADDDM